MSYNHNVKTRISIIKEFPSFIRSRAVHKYKGSPLNLDLQDFIKKIMLGYLGGSEGGLHLSDCTYLAFQLSFHPYQSSCEIRKQSNKIFFSFKHKPQNMKIIYFFHTWMVLGVLTSKQVNENFRAVRPLHRADICITREKHNHHFFHI